MTHTITPRRDIPNVALLTALLTVAICYLSIATLATTPAPASADGSGPTGTWGHVASKADVPTLTNDVAQPSAGAEPQLTLGIGLLAIGLVGLVIGLAAYRRPAGDGIATGVAVASRDHRHASTRLSN